MIGATPSARNTLGSMLVGTAISFMLHGVTSCQTIWYFRTQSSRSSKIMKALILSIWLTETLNCVFMFFTTLNSFFSPAVVYVQTHSNPCGDWNKLAQAIASTICTSYVEGFFIMRIWRLSEMKKLTTLAFIPYAAGQETSILLSQDLCLNKNSLPKGQIVRSFQINCNPAATNLSPILIFGVFGCKLFGDGIVAVAMCYMLHTRSSGFTRHTNTIKVVRALILWSISTGLLTWFVGVLFLLSYVGILPSGYAIYFIRGGLYANAALAQLNARTRYQTMAEATVSLSIHLDTISSGQPVNYEPQPVEPIAE